MKVLGYLEGTPELTDELGLYNKVGDLHLKLRNPTAAVEQYEKAISHYADQGFPNNAIALCNKVLRNAPGRTHIYLRLAKLMLQRGFVSESKQNLLEYAERMQKAGKLDEAFQALREFADLSPDNEEIRLLLAEQLKKAAHTEEAHEQLEKLYQEVLAMGDSRKARQTLERMKAIDPEYDVDEAALPAVKTKRAKSSDIVFIDLDEDIAPQVEEIEEASQPTDAFEESVADQEEVVATAEDGELSVEPTAFGEAAEIVDEARDDELGLERALEEPRLESVGATGVIQIEGLDAGGPFDVDEDVEVQALDVEPTALEDSLVEDEIPEGGELPLIATPGEEDEELLEEGEEVPAFAEDLLAVGSGVEVPELDVGFDEQLESISDMDEIEDVPDLPEIPMLDAGVTTLDEIEEEAEEVAVTALDDDAAVEVGLELDEAIEVAETAGPDLAALEDMILDDPDAPGPHRELGEALVEQGDRERGIEELDIALVRFEALGDWQHAESVAEEILRIEPNSVHHHQKRVEYAFRGGDKDALADAYLELADALVRDGSLERACNVYERVLDHDPESYRAKTALETLMPAAEEEAVAGELEAEPVEAFGGTTGEIDAVVDEVLEIAAPEPIEAIAPEPKPIEAVAPEPEPVPLEPAIEPPRAEPAAAAAAASDDFVDLGAFIMDDEVSARDTRMRIREEEPTGDEERDFQEMLSEFKKGIEANVALDDSQAHYDLGIAFKEMGLLDEAISEFQKALRSVEGRLKTAESLGLCFFEKRQFAVAATVLRRALESEPGGDDAKIGVLYWLGRCEEEQGNGSVALGYYQRIFSVDIEFQDVRERVKNLAQGA
jgi:tetratricopeptide (TPR) repeat protein